MNGFVTYQSNVSRGGKEHFVEVHANEYERGEVRKAVAKAREALLDAYRRTEDEDQKRELISAEVTLKAVGDAFDGKSTAF